MKKISAISGIGILSFALLSFGGNDECEKLKSEKEVSVDDIVFIETEEEIELGFDTAEYLPIGFDAYDGMELDLDHITFIEVEEEIELGFDTTEFLPVGFDAKKGMGLDLSEIDFVEIEEEVELGFDTAEYLPTGFNPYAGMKLDLDEIDFIGTEEEIDLGFDTAEYLPAGFNPYQGMEYVNLIETAASTTEPKIDLKTGNDSKSLVLELDATSGESEVQLSDANDNIVHYENVSKNTYIKKFNLKNLENGTYYLTVENPIKKAVYTVTLKNREIKIADKRESSQIPVLRKSGDRIYLNLLNTDLNTVRVKVVNGNNEPLESQIFKGDLTVGEVFNFENAIRDNYLVVVQDGKNTYRQSISIE